MAKRDGLHLVEVEWVDASCHQDSGWHRRATVVEGNKDLVLHSCGYLVDDKGPNIVLAGSINDSNEDDQRLAEVQSIPKLVVRSVTLLRYDRPYKAD